MSARAGVWEQPRGKNFKIFPPRHVRSEPGAQITERRLRLVCSGIAGEGGEGGALGGHQLPPVQGGRPLRLRPVSGGTLVIIKLTSSPPPTNPPLSSCFFIVLLSFLHLPLRFRLLLLSENELPSYDLAEEKVSSAPSLRGFALEKKNLHLVSALCSSDKALGGGEDHQVAEDAEELGQIQEQRQGRLLTSWSFSASGGQVEPVTFCVFTSQLVRRIYKGIPLQLRGEVWCLLLDIPKIKEEKKDFYEVRLRLPATANKRLQFLSARMILTVYTHVTQ